MRIKSEGFEFSVVFDTHAVQRLTATGTEVVDQTRALVHVYEEGSIDPVGGAIGFSYRSPQDKPNEWTGRMWALERAVEEFTPYVASDITDAFWRARLADEALEASMVEAERETKIRDLKAQFMVLYADAQGIKDQVLALQAAGAK